MINKKSLLNQLISIIKDEIHSHEKSFKAAKNAAIESPHRMQSRYDTMAIESAWVADGFAKALIEKQLSLQQLENLQIKEKIERVCLGCVVGVSFNETSNIEYFFIVPVASSNKIYHNNRLITTLTPATPLGRALIGKEIGDTSKISITQNRAFTIAELY